jgi:GxxExxY protein
MEKESQSIYWKNLRAFRKVGGSTITTMKIEIYKDEGYKLMGGAFEVYNEQGHGLAEEIYQESLEIELEMRGIPFRSKQDLASFYKGRELKKRYVPDLFVFGCLVVELKAVSQLFPEHEAQLINYMHITKQPVDYLINFVHKDTLESKRFILSELIPASKNQHRLAQII